MIDKNTINKHLVLINVVTSGAQVLLIGLVYIFLYKFLLKLLGIELLGVWSVVLSTSSLANLANFGIADSVVRFVALFKKERDEVKIKQLIFTSTIFLTLLFLLIACIIYPFADLILKAVLPAKYVKDGLRILPYSLICLIVNSINGVYASVLDGMQKNYVRNLIFTASSILLLVGAYLLVPKYRLEGVAFAQIVQSGFALIACFSLVTYYTRFNPLKWNWSKTIFKQIFSYGMKFQFVSLAAMLNEPVTKILLSKFGGMAFAGYYEMANRLLMQTRGVIVSATQSLVPVMVTLEKKEIPDFYKKVFSNVLFFSTTGMALIVISSRLVSLYWIGSYQPIFCYTLLILATSLLINILNAPAYFYYMADGNLNVLIKTHLILGLLNAVIGYGLGHYFGGYGVIFGWFFAVVFSSVYITIVFNRMFEIKLSHLFSVQDIIFILLMVALVLFNKIYPVDKGFKIVDFGCLLLMTGYIAFHFFKFKVGNFRSGSKV